MSEFSDTIREMLSRFAPVEVRSMFGGYGVFRDGLMFALVYDSELYLKTSPETVSRFEQSGSRPFVYTRGGKLVQMSYYSAPAEMFDGPDVARQWVELAWKAARR